jgi:hypothetical protein
VALANAINPFSDGSPSIKILVAVAAYQDAAADYLFRLNNSNVGILTSKHSIDPIQQRLAELSKCLASLLMF